MYDTTAHDAALLQQLSQGDESAFRRLFDAYHPFIYSFALRMTDSAPIAKDVVQDIFIKIWLMREEMPSVQNLPAYINRLTRNHVLNGMKRKAMEASLLKDLGGQLDVRHNDTEERSQARELETLLEKAVLQLPAQQQKVYRLSRGEGLKHEEIAAQLGISRETVKKHMMAALVTVRRFLQENGRMISLLATMLAHHYK